MTYLYVVKSGDSGLWGPFDGAEAAAEWIRNNQYRFKDMLVICWVQAAIDA